MTTGIAGRARQTLASFAGSALAFLASLVVVGLLLLTQGRDPFRTYQGMFIGAFGSAYAVTETLVAATPIMLCALGVAVGAWVGLITIGAEGQLYMGALGATYAAMSMPHSPAWQVLPLMFCSACLLGALWSGIPGLLRARFGVNETILTLLLNYVAVLIVLYLIHGPWRDPLSFSWPQTAAFSPAAQLPRFGSTRLHLGLCFGVGIAGLLWMARSRTRWGFIAKVVGAGPRVAAYAHYPVARYLVGAMLLSGAIAAIAGMGQVSAIEGRLRAVLSPGYGYTGFLVAWLARHNPIGIVLVSVLMGGLLSGGDSLQLGERLPAATINIIQGLIFFFLLGSERYIKRFSQSARGETTT